LECAGAESLYLQGKIFEKLCDNWLTGEGSGKTYLACLAAYRLLNYTSTKRILFLVDRNNLARQTESEFNLFDRTENQQNMGSLYQIKRLRKESDIKGDIIISTIQKLFAFLTGQTLIDESEDTEDELDTRENDENEDIISLGDDIKLPPDYFQLIIVDECHRSIYGKWKAEIQDLAGYDLDIIKSLLQADCDVTMVGDPRQVTYHTHNEAKYKKYADGKIEDFIRIECKKIDCVIDKESLNDSYRNNQSICSYSSQLYEEYGETGTKQFEVTGHDGVFLVRQDDVAAYLEEFKPMQLREKRTVKVNDGYAAINMGESKGLTFDRVLIYPTGTMKSWMKNHSKTLQPKTRSQFYVAVTRAKYSVGIVFDYNEKTNIEGVEKYR
jgi:DNA helicase-2/ATP-dependent DNA helicase PcrA